MNILERFSLKGKVIVVTGGTGILGKAFVKGLAEAGAKICIIGRSQEKAAERVKLVETLGGDALAVVADVMDEHSIREAKERILEKWGTIDGLVNAAGGNIPGATIAPGDSIFDNKIGDTIKAIELNLFGTIIPTMIFGEVMAEKGTGSIINISSLAASRPITRVLGYTVAKHGVDGFTKWMATELALRYSNRIRVNAIAPGVFLTEQNRTLLTNEDGSYTERADKFVQNTPFQRLGDPSELEGTLVYLLSDASAFVSGETIFVDGGFNSWCGV
ncbi:NAD(P)-dependent dehydrogenase (short-subunit alcohol dehydrogenase family) [Sphingobacterium allocomposti]|uniref:NAD(P)-dependent dehydrogenase (Short-subunit alcohol dehydrogenase family) n=1 Tax=Sphingobacterium allocomposti TaxID=415956 RepID=A0A5S5CWV3_9SPHI|nr:SDR family oxidoreductase [Sphingobacterium composti Yoo et al. 2007 non Ten et al. 2007]TYP88291.1 NAD(P)-dependent dehydrogenase (short-subunit alcohol dehydrogenase family) [Sphingobacterium composti Yoo et al. 2007 non Ten et al. 2007]